LSKVAHELLEEELQEREEDRQYWTPLRKELEEMRHARVSGGSRPGAEQP
jgi:hypothetical protein